MVSRPNSESSRDSAIQRRLRCVFSFTQRITRRRPYVRLTLAELSCLGPNVREVAAQTQ
jgi:hypothetical protein